MGPSQELPGFDENFRFAFLPFWGNHCLIDFLVAAFDFSPRPDISIVLREDARDASLLLGSRWRKPLARVFAVEDGLAGIARLVSQSDAEIVVLGATSSVFLAEPAALCARITEVADDVVKVSISRTPVEIFACRREKLASIISAAADRESGHRSIRESLFDGVLHDALDLIVDIPGQLLFQNDLMEYYTNNIWVVANGKSPQLHAALSRLPELAEKPAESHVAERGSIRNSWLSAGVEVEGSVEDSILFPNVVVRRNASVSRAVVLNGNRIGAGTEIQSTLVLPFDAEVPRPAPNIGDNCSIGARTSAVKNADFPAQIRNGISVVGMNCDIPNGFKAEAASYIAPGVSAGTLRKLKVLRKGSSVLRDRPAASSVGKNGSREPR